MRSTKPLLIVSTTNNPPSPSSRGFASLHRLPVFCRTFGARAAIPSIFPSSTRHAASLHCKKGGRPRAGGRGMHRGRPGEGGGGAGGSRTHVRTRKPHAFYTLIPDFIFERRQDLDHQPAPYPLKFHHDGEAHPDYFRFSCAAGSSDSEQHPWGDVSFPHLVKELS